MFHVKQNIKAVLFDYNGTLFFDSDINEIAWRNTINELTNNSIDFDEIYKEYKSVRNVIFVSKVFEMMNYPIDQEKILYWAKRKETKYYHEYCRAHNRKSLSPGAEELLNYLIEKNIPINLCTASLIENVDFYFDYVGIGKWFNKNKIAYDDGSFKNKVDMYKACAERISIPIDQCLVIEDSAKSINEAIEAGCKNIIAIRKDDTPTHKEIIQIVDDLSEIDYSIFD